jgi:signal transduction histidine kinase/ligand-binding sensor domain-containing protein
MLCSATKLFSRSRAALLALLITSVFALVHSARAHAETLGSYYHTSFLKQDGAPTDIGGLTQTSDGFLWIAGTKGLTRFDGNAFKAFHALPGESLPDAQLDELYPAEGGGLWIAHDTKGVTLLKNGHLSDFGPDRGYLGTDSRFIRDNKGHVWSYTTAALMRFEKGSWQVIYRNSPGHDIVSHANFDNDGNLWAVIEHRLFVLPVDGSQFREAPGGPDGAWHVFAGASGRLYVVADKNELHIYRRNGLSLVEEAKPVSAPIYSVLESRNGSLWLGSTLEGLYYISSDDLAAAESDHTSPKLQHLTQADGLTNNYVVYLLEDTEGDIWLGTSTGLDRFRRAAFTQIDLPPGIHTVSASVDRLGNLWVGSETNPLLFGPPSGELKDTALGRLTLASYVDPRDESVWATNVQGVWQLIPGAPRLERPLTSKEVGFIGTLPCMLRDRQGTFYVCIPHNGRGNGLLVSDGDSWKEVFDHPVFPLALATDVKGNIWVGSKDTNRLYKLWNGTQTLLSEQQGLAVGVVRAIYAGADTLWVGGDAGIQFFDGRRFVTLLSDNQEIMQPVSGLVEDRHGDLWAQTLDGVLRIRAADIWNFSRGALKQVHVDLFDDADGLPGRTGLAWTNPTLRLGPDGKIWAQTETGLAWIDPDHIPTENNRPVVYIDGLDRESHGYSVIGSEIQLPPSKKALRISYTSPSLSRPEKITFRYRLIGMTDTWQQAGDRREATFTNVPAGTYRFEVIATNGNGLSSPAATISFKRLPAYYEAWWFRAVWALPTTLILWIALDMRARALARRLKIRSDEREAIARDIHDTLLQRLHAVMLSLKGLSSDEAIPVKSRETIAQLCNETRDAIIEGRGQILALRRGQDAGLALYDQLMAEGRRLQAGGNAHFGLELRGAPRDLRCGPEIELRSIALEAMRNAFTHSGASKVVVTFNYENRAFWLVVSDDGVGFRAEEADKARREGHFGLVGMRERAAALKGTINIESSPEEGTEVHIRVPARVIYVSTKDRQIGPNQPVDNEPIST